jgi:predicted nucleic acid-binding Zn ribbon protein
MADAPEPLSEILARLFVARGWGARQDRLRLEKAWRAAVGAESSRRTQLGTLRRGVLEILVRDAVLLHELSHFRKRQLLQVFAEQLGQGWVRDLRFRLAHWHE